MVLITITEMILALTWWVCKKTLSNVFYYIWPVAPNTAQEISEIKKTLQELKQLELDRRKAENKQEIERIEKRAQDLMEKSCPDLYSSICLDKERN